MTIQVWMCWLPVAILFHRSGCSRCKRKVHPGTNDRSSASAADLRQWPNRIKVLYRIYRHYFLTKGDCLQRHYHDDNDDGWRQTIDTEGGDWALKVVPDEKKQSGNTVITESSLDGWNKEPRKINQGASVTDR